MIATSNECRFDEETHTYWRGSVELPSVTTIIQSVWPRFDGAPADAIAKAQLRGIWVDREFSRFLRGEWEGSFTATGPAEYQDCLGMAIDWWESERAGAKVKCQVQLFGEREAGTADLIIERAHIIDLKSTYDISKTVQAQLGGYASIYSEVVITCGVLHVHKRLKKAKFVEYSAMECHRQWSIVRDMWRLINGR